MYGQYCWTDLLYKDLGHLARAFKTLSLIGHLVLRTRLDLLTLLGIQTCGFIGASRLINLVRYSTSWFYWHFQT